MEIGLTQNLKTIKEIDGKQLYYSFLSGAQRIFENQKHLNKINVFPVADADTGTNLASTMRSIMDAVIPTDNPKTTAVALADAALTGARGNSGIIFAQFLYGFSNEIKNEGVLDVHSFADSMRKAVTYAYDAIANPIEGTILTVIKDWAEYMYSIKDLIDDFIKLLIEAYQKAQQSLLNTSKQLEVLAKSHVVDAGAKGFVVFLEGILDFFIKGELSTREPVAVIEDEEMLDTHEVINFRYCSEAMITGEKLDKKKINKALVNFGDSLVIAGNPKKMRIHIHTDTPADLFATIQKFGTISYQKVDDMVMQNEIVNNRKANIALVTDSGCDIPKYLLDKYQIHVVPLTIHFGEKFFIDRMTIQPQQFYDLLNRNKIASSAQPSIKDFQNKYEYLSTHYDSIIGINLSKGLSGTFNSSFQASKEVSARTGKKISVFDSRNVTGGQGMLLLRAAEAIEQGMPHEQLEHKIQEWICKSGIRVSVKTMKWLVKSGRVSQLKGFLAKALDLKPVIALDENGKASTFTKSFTEQGNMQKVMKSIRAVAEEGNIWNYTITHADNEKTAAWYSAEMEKLTGKKPLFVASASPSLVANVGPGVVCIAYMLE